MMLNLKEPCIVKLRYNTQHESNSIRGLYWRLFITTFYTDGKEETKMHLVHSIICNVRTKSYTELIDSKMHFSMVGLAQEVTIDDNYLAVIK